MRLGQLSRKLDIKPNEIREFIRKEFKVEVDSDLNTRLEDNHVAALSSRFEPKEKPVLETIKKEEVQQKEPIEARQQKESEALPTTPEPPIADESIPAENTLPSSSAETASSEVVKENPEAFIPLPVDPNAELIKVPKIKLEGLKVVGKIDLPQPKSNSEAVSETSENKPEGEGLNSEYAQSFQRTKKADRETTSQGEQDEEEFSIYKDKRGIYHFSQTQRENRKNSLERIKREQLEQKRKEKKIKHYQQVVVTSENKTETPKSRNKKNNQKETRKPIAKPERKGVWGKFLNWLNG
jgi:hypothetical protein